VFSPCVLTCCVLALLRQVYQHSERLSGGYEMLFATQREHGFSLFHDISGDTGPHKRARFELDVTLLRRHLATEPRCLRAQVYLAQSLLNLERLPEALDAYAQALRLDGELQREHEEQHQQSSSALPRPPFVSQRHDCLFMLGQISERLGLPFEQTRLCYARAFRECPKPESLFYVARRLAALQELTEAAAVVKLALQAAAADEPGGSADAPAAAQCHSRYAQTRVAKEELPALANQLQAALGPAGWKAAQVAEARSVLDVWQARGMGVCA
jgi:tetratricopeptide (TPR) repeat protein